MSLCSICLPDENRDVTALHLQFCLFTYVGRRILFKLLTFNGFSLTEPCTAFVVKWLTIKFLISKKP